MSEKTDADLDAIYKDANAHSHGAALRAIYQAGRADEALAAKDQADHAKSRHENDLKSAQAALAGFRRTIANPGAPVAPVTSQPVRSVPPADVGAPPAAASEANPPVHTNIPNTPNPGTDPPVVTGGTQASIEHPAANAGA